MRPVSATAHGGGAVDGSHGSGQRGACGWRQLIADRPGGFDEHARRARCRADLQPDGRILTCSGSIAASFARRRAAIVPRRSAARHAAPRGAAAGRLCIPPHRRARLGRRAGGDHFRPDRGAGGRGCRHASTGCLHGSARCRLAGQHRHRDRLLGSRHGDEGRRLHGRRRREADHRRGCGFGTHHHQRAPRHHRRRGRDADRDAYRRRHERGHGRHRFAEPGRDHHPVRRHRDRDGGRCHRARG